MQCEAMKANDGYYGRTRCTKDGKYEVEGTRGDETRTLHLCGTHRNEANRGRGILIYSGKQARWGGDGFNEWKTMISEDERRKKQIDRADQALRQAASDYNFMKNLYGAEALSYLEVLLDGFIKGVHKDDWTAAQNTAVVSAQRIFNRLGEKRASVAEAQETFERLSRANQAV